MSSGRGFPKILQPGCRDLLPFSQKRFSQESVVHIGGSELLLMLLTDCLEHASNLRTILIHILVCMRKKKHCSAYVSWMRCKCFLISLFFWEKNKKTFVSDGWRFELHSAACFKHTHLTNHKPADSLSKSIRKPQCTVLQRLSSQEEW